MTYPLVHDLAVGAVPLAVTCGLVFHHSVRDARFLQDSLAIHPDWYPEDAYFASSKSDVVSHTAPEPWEPVQ